MGAADAFDAIIEDFNQMARELSGVETLRTDFIANVSHELKTPLAVIQNYGSLLQDPALPKEQRVEYAKAVTDASRRLADLIANILKLNKLENQQIFPQAETYDLGEQLRECLLGFEDAWEAKELAVEADIPDGVAVRTDRELLTLVWNLFGLLRSRPVELLHSASAGEREPRTRRLLVVLGAVTLGAGYATALTVEDPFTALAYFFLAVALVMVGTYCLFTAGSIALLKHLRNSPRYYYQPKHFTAVAGLLYRMKQNAVGLANICILSTMVLVTVSTTVSLYAGLEGALERMYPYDVDVVQSLDEVPPEQETTLNEDTLERVQAAAADAGRKVELLQWSTPGDTVGYYTGNTFTLVAQEGVSTEIRLLTADDYGRLTGHTVDLEPEEVLVQAENLDLPDTFYIEDLPFHIAGTIMDFPRYNSSILISGQTAQLFLVVADETVVSAISDRDASRVHREFRVQVDLDGTEEEKLAFVDPLLAADANDVYSVISHQDNAVDLYTMYGGFLFLGVFLGLLFLLSTVLIIYYKQISEGYEDQRRYQIMQQVGMSPREVRSSIRSQVLLVFFLPLVTAGIHVAAAFPMLCKLLELFNLFDVRLFALCAAGTLLVFCAIYALVYGLTTRTYSRIVGGQ